MVLDFSQSNFIRAKNRNIQVQILSLFLGATPGVLSKRYNQQPRFPAPSAMQGSYPLESGILILPFILTSSHTNPGSF